MATPSEIAEQVQFERDAIASGLKKLRDQTSKLEQQAYASATVYGNVSIDTMLPLVTARIEETVKVHVKEGKNGQSFKEIHCHLKDVETTSSRSHRL